MVYGLPHSYRKPVSPQEKIEIDAENYWELFVNMKVLFESATINDFHEPEAAIIGWRNIALCE